MSTAALQNAIERASKARANLDTLNAQLADVVEKSAQAKQAFDDAKDAAQKAAAGQVLGETKPAQMAAAKKASADAEEKHLALLSAAEEIRLRISRAMEQLDELDQAAMDAARPVAKELAAFELERAQTYAQMFASTLSVWYDLATAANGGHRRTGVAQQNDHGCLPMLRAQGIRGVDSFAIGSPHGIEKPPTPARVLELAEKLNGAEVA